MDRERAEEQIQMIRDYNEALRAERDMLRADYRRLEQIRHDLMRRCERMKSLEGLSLDEIAARQLEREDTLRAEAARLREALEPFAMRVKQYPPWMWTAMIEREKQGIVTGGFRVGGEAITHMPAMCLVDAQSALSFTPATAEWLAARDAEQRRIGAAEWLEKAAARLRAGKGE